MPEAASEYMQRSRLSAAALMPPGRGLRISDEWTPQSSIVLQTRNGLGARQSTTRRPPTSARRLPVPAG